MSVLEAVEIRGDAPELRAALLEGELPVADLEDPGRLFFRIENEGQLLGYAGLEIFGADALLRSIVVPGRLRGQGHGRTLVDAAQREASRRGVTQLWLFTSSAVGFFSHLGYAVTPREAAPATILATRQATKICATAAMLARRIAPSA